MIDGVIPVLKPVHYTSHDVVAVMRKLLGVKRVGHTGTLDPMVPGVLPICVGRATRMVEYIQDLPKQYEVVMKLGMSSDTEDASGQIIDVATDVKITETDLKRALIQFIGEIEQVPPMYSAVKVQGKRLYELARQGMSIERSARKVTIYEIQCLHMALDEPQPEIKLSVLCSKGTYMRTLCVDIGRALGYPALMSSLVRTATGRIQLSDCLTLEQIEHYVETDTLHQHIIQTDEAVSHIRAYVIDDQYVKRVLQGQKISAVHVKPMQADEDVYVHDGSSAKLMRVYSPKGYFLGIFRIEPNTQLLTAVKVFGDAEQAY